MRAHHQAGTVRLADLSADTAQLTAYLITGFVSFLKAEQYPVVVPWLFEIGKSLPCQLPTLTEHSLLAFSDVTASLGTATYTQLLRLGPAVGSQTSGLRLSHVLIALARLGASQKVLDRHEWTKLVNGASPSTKVSDEGWRDEMTYRLLSLVAAFAQ